MAWHEDGHGTTARGYAEGRLGESARDRLWEDATTRALSEIAAAGDLGMSMDEIAEALGETASRESAEALVLWLRATGGLETCSDEAEADRPRGGT